MIQGLLWLFGAVLALVITLGLVTQGREFLGHPGFWPNLVCIPVVIVGLVANRMGRFTLAVVLLQLLTITLATVHLLDVGIVGNLTSLLVLVTPTIVAGLVLTRAFLYGTAAVTALLVLSIPLLHQEGLLPGQPDSADPGWTVALEAVLLYALVTYLIDRFGVLLRDGLAQSIVRQYDLEQQVEENARVQAQLLESQQFTDSVIESLPGLFTLVDEDGYFYRWNRNFADTTGYDDEEIPQLNPVDLVEGEEKATMAAAIDETFRVGNAAAEVTLITRDGSRLPYYLTGSKTTFKGRSYIAGVGLDRSEIAAAQQRIASLNQELAERLERITALHEIDRAITGSLDLDLTLGVVLQQVTMRLRVDAAAILLYRPGTRTLRYSATRGTRTKRLSATTLRLGESLAGQVARTRERVLVTNREELLEAFSDPQFILEEEFHSYAAVPLIAKGQLQGVLELYHRAPLEATEEWLSYLVTLATQAAIALDSAKLFEELQRSNVELREAYDLTIEGWARALDLRDQDTRGHSERVTELTLRLAQHLGMSDEELVHVRRGALLHDIGKMGVPDRILLKPGPLDEEEWEIMRQHPVYAFQFIAPIPFLRPALDIPYAHHERWDGSGYPRGLQRELIPPAARIFAVVDVYDALTSNRPYRKALSAEEALAHIREQSGILFDPQVVAAFEEMMATEPRE